ncbi:Leucine-rich repeat-containing protein [Plasmodiophora brassicae]
MASADVVEGVRAEDGSMEHFLDLYKGKCDNFGDDPHPLIIKRVNDAIERGWSLYPRQQLSSLLLNGASLSEKEKIQDDDVFALSESLTAFADASITSIDLSVNNIENNGAKALSAMMRSTQTLRSLNLRANGIGEVGGLALAHALEGQRSIVDINLNGNPIGDAGRAFAKPMLMLTRVDLGNTEMGINAIIQIAKSMQTNTTVTELSIENPRILTLDDEGSIHLSTMIATNTTLTSLNLSKNRIRDQGVEWLVKGLSQNKTLRTLNLRCIANPILSNQIGPGGAVLLAGYFSGPCSITDLNLAGNRIIDEGGKAIAGSLRTNMVLERLDLSYTSLAEPGLVALSDVVAGKTASKLKSLMLWGNFFTPAAGTVFRNALSTTRLTDFDFRPLIQEE